MGYNIIIFGVLISVFSLALGQRYNFSSYDNGTTDYDYGRNRTRNETRYVDCGFHTLCRRLPEMRNVEFQCGCNTCACNGTRTRYRCFQEYVPPRHDYEKRACLKQGYNIMKMALEKKEAKSKTRVDCNHRLLCHLLPGMHRIWFPCECNYCSCNGPSTRKYCTAEYRLPRGSRETAKCMREAYKLIKKARRAEANNYRKRY